MQNLIIGNLEINGISLYPGLMIDEVKERLLEQKFQLFVIDETDKAISFDSTSQIEIGDKKFSVSIQFEHHFLWLVTLKAVDPTRNEWDYRELMRQHGDWLEEQIGYPEGALPEIKYNWGKVSQWYDPRARDAGISIKFNY